MDDLAGWLDGLGLGKYRAVFAEHEIDLATLPELTEDDLREMGLPIGPRRKLLKAARGLAGAAPRADHAAQAPPPVPTPQGGAERRQLTVMFADLVGSTELSQCLDPEELRDVIRVYQDACAGAVSRYDGYVARYVGDGLLAYFGYPRAHEDDAERAVRAALAILEAVARLPAQGGRPLQVRVGIATGQVVVGDIVGEGAAQESTVVGETPNLAARLQGVASPDSVVISARTRELLGGEFELEDLGPQVLRGIAGAVPAWRVNREQTAPSRFEARHPGELGAFVGRDQEVELLLARWQRAKQGEGQVALLSGEAGIGKSRIAQTLRARLQGDAHVRVQYQCSPHHANSPLYPVIRQFAFAADFARDDDAGTRLAKLESLLARSPLPPEDVALLASLLSIPAGPRYPRLDMPPQEQKQKTLQALVRGFESLARQAPLLLILEDAHWIDPTTRDLMDIMVERAASLPMLLLATHRPEFESPWSRHAHTTVLELNRLGRDACRLLVADLTRGRRLPEVVMRQIIAKTDGIPLFVEELTRTVLESDLLERREDAYVLTGPLPPLAIPSTLQDSLMARLDRLEGIKEVCQIGAAIGREFGQGLLAAVSHMDERELGHALDRLVESGIVFRRGTGPEAVYVFKHALIQDTAYDALLRSRRQQIHAGVAQALRTQFAEQVANEPEVLAHHYSQAALHAEAAPQWLLAGQRAVARSANVEAVAHLRRGIEAVAHVVSKAQASSLELDMQISLGSALIALQGYSSTETEAAYLRGRSLLDELGEDARRFPVLHGLCMLYWNRAALDRNLEVAQDMLRRAVQQDETLPKLVAHRVLAVVLNPLGRFERARAHAEQALSLYDPVRHRDTAHLYGHDMGVGALWHLAIALLFQGHVDRSKTFADRASDLARSLNNATTLAYDALWFSFTSLLRRDWETARARAEQMIEEASRRSMALWVVFGRYLFGSALAALGRSEAALDQLRQGRQAADRLEHSIARPLTLRFEAQALADLHRTDEALERLEQALAIIDATGERWLESEVHRALGEVRRQDGAFAEACFVRAIQVARTQDARLLELRAASSLARLWRDDGRECEARDVLLPVYQAFTEGFDAPDVAEARALVEELA